MGNKKSGKQWVQSHNKDCYVRQARLAHYRSRAVYKLQQIDQKDNLFKPNASVVDIGSAPGSWSQYAVESVGPDGRVIAVDMLPMEPIDGVILITGDFADEAVEKACMEHTGNHTVDLVISDMAPNLSGIRATDQARTMALAERVLSFSLDTLKQGGDLLIKLFEGVGTSQYRQSLKEHFAKVMTRKPGASKYNSREFYVLARSYRL